VDKLLGLFFLCSTLIFFNEGAAVLVVFEEVLPFSGIFLIDLFVFYRIDVEDCLGVLTEALLGL
jgi:hypothetical protein